MLRFVQERYGIPPGDLWVKMRSGRTGDHRHELSAETRRALDAMWRRELEGPLGFATYNELRAYLATRPQR
jgi:hypothetical protein